jgi:ketosteroid isomerase-like protein
LTAEENSAVLHAMYAAWSDQDLDALLRSAHPDFELRTSGAFPDLDATYHGHEGVRSFWDAVLTPWDSFRIDVDRIVEGDDCAATAIRFRARGKGSGALTDLPQGHCARFKDGQIVSISLHSSFEEALQAAGLGQ